MTKYLEQSYNILLVHAALLVCVISSTTMEEVKINAKIKHKFHVLFITIINRIIFVPGHHGKFGGVVDGGAGVVVVVVVVLVVVVGAISAAHSGEMWTHVRMLFCHIVRGAHDISYM